MCMYICVILYYFLLSDVDVLKSSPPDKLKVLELLANVTAKWKIIGVALGVDDNTLDGIDKSNDTNVLKLNSVINTWINTKSSPYTWETLISAIEGGLVKEKVKADEIRAYVASLPH